MIILPAKLSELTESSKANSTGSSLANSSPGSTQTSKRNTINHVQSSSKYDANMVCYAGCDMWCICKIWQGMNEPGLNVEILVCHWKGEVISVEIDIKIAGIGDTVWKWQAKQIWHRSAIISKWPTKCIKINMLQHSNMTTKYMAGIHSWSLTKDEHWDTANSSINRFKQAWQKCKR